MTSQARLDANRKNARRSTGPRTEEGKQASSKNDTRHGFFARLLPVEEPAYHAMLTGSCGRTHVPLRASERRLLCVAECFQHPVPVAACRAARLRGGVSSRLILRDGVGVRAAKKKETRENVWKNLVLPALAAPSNQHSRPKRMASFRKTAIRCVLPPPLPQRGRGGRGMRALGSLRKMDVRATAGSQGLWRTRFTADSLAGALIPAGQPCRRADSRGTALPAR